MTRWCFLLPAVSSTLLLMVLAICVYGSVCSSPVLINEVYYDHPGSDKGFEFIELYCPGAMEVPLDGWSVALIDGRTGTLRELWRAGPEMSVQGGGLLLLGGDSCGVAPEFLLNDSIENGPDCVVLLREGEDIDLVGYGGDDLECSPGRSLSRCPDGKDSDDTGSDFVCVPPTPGLVNFHETDLSVRFEGNLHVICISRDTNIAVILENTGLLRYSGMVDVIVSTVQGKARDIAGSRYLTCDLDSGEARAVSIRCAGMFIGSSTVEVRIEAEGDTNSSNDLISEITSSSPGDIVINEIMYRPAGGSEWIEILNRSASSLDLSRWSVTDQSGSSGSIDEGIVLGAGSYLIIAQDPVSFSDKYQACRAEVISLTGGWPRLNDGSGEGPAEEIFIRREDGGLVESVSYPAPIFDEKGRSIERLSPVLCSQGLEGIWLRCGADAGSTPGEVNYCHTREVPAAGISASPDPFCPGRDGAVRFTASAVSEETSFGASMFDIEGREISRLASGTAGAPAVSFIWDGVCGNGRPVETGIYICVVEFKCGGGGICRREKCIVRVWAGHR